MVKCHYLVTIMVLNKAHNKSCGCTSETDFAAVAIVGALKRVCNGPGSNRPLVAAEGRYG